MIDIETFFKQELIRVNESVASQEEFFQQAFQQLYQLGYVKQEYLKALTDREQEFPTGLQTHTIDVAIPHTDPQFIKQPFIYVMRPATKVPFQQMGSLDAVKVQAGFIFILGFSKGEDQLILLQNLIGMFSDEAFMAEIAAIEQQEQLYQALITYFNPKNHKGA